MHVPVIGILVVMKMWKRSKGSMEMYHLEIGFNRPL